MRILIAEDNENSRVLLEFMLEANGYDVASADNGKAALELALYKPPDLIISDILMPEMDGYAFCRAVKRSELLHSIPFIFYTATYTDPSDEKFAMELGASRFILKPMEVDAFLLVLREILETHAVEDLPVPDHPLKNEQELQKSHADVLAKKLDQKVRQLEGEKKRLLKSEVQYRRLVEALRDEYFFYTHDTNRSFAYVSPSITNVLGYTQEEFLVHHAEYHPVSAINDAMIHHTELGIRGIKQPPYEVEIYHKDGSMRRLEVTEEPVLGEHGLVVAIEGIAHDITRRISAEIQLAQAKERLQQSQKMEAIGTLAGGIAHDFNNLLTPILGFTETTLFDLPDGCQGKIDLQEVLNAAYRARELVKQILTFSRYAEKEKSPVLLQALVTEALKLLRSSIPTTIEIRQSIDPDCEVISANPTQMHQILMNLGTNAYYSMRKNGGILAVSLAEIEILSGFLPANPDLQEGKYLRLEVSDTGTGIDKDKRERIFEPYFTTKPQDKGTGLGLSVVHGIVTSHGGHISVYSEPGQGTTFHVYLPVMKKLQATEVPDCMEEIPGGSERILFVEDNEVISRMCREQLERLGYQVLVQPNGAEAVEVCRNMSQKIDLVITDMTMPNMTGSELAQKLFEIEPELPIILCSGFSELIDREKAISMGIKDYLMKPVSRKKMATAVRDVLDRKKEG